MNAVSFMETPTFGLQAVVIVGKKQQCEVPTALSDADFGILGFAFSERAHHCSCAVARDPGVPAAAPEGLCPHPSTSRGANDPCDISGSSQRKSMRQTFAAVGRGFRVETSLQDAVCIQLRYRLKLR
jgi:hypothetical protein